MKTIHKNHINENIKNGLDILRIPYELRLQPISPSSMILFAYLSKNADSYHPKIDQILRDLPYFQNRTLLRHMAELTAYNMIKRERSSLKSSSFVTHTILQVNTFPVG